MACHVKIFRFFPHAIYVNYISVLSQGIFIFRVYIELDPPKSSSVITNRFIPVPRANNMKLSFENVSLIATLASKTYAPITD